MMKKLTYQTEDGCVVYVTAEHPHSMPWVGQRALIPHPGRRRLVVEQIHGGTDGYVAVVGDLRSP